MEQSIIYDRIFEEFSQNRWNNTVKVFDSWTPRLAQTDAKVTYFF